MSLEESHKSSEETFTTLKAELEAVIKLKDDLQTDNDAITDKVIINDFKNILDTQKLDLSLKIFYHNTFVAFYFLPFFRLAYFRYLIMIPYKKVFKI